MPIVLLLYLCATLASLPLAAASGAATPPNVILIITDDQGYGDVGAHGNRMLRTPNLDRLHGESVRLTNFHVDPTCAPTRAALMTGRYSSRTGVWHTIAGRSLMARDEVTLAEQFRKAGYRTGLFGKWHLGDNYPLRPQDRGFQEVVMHGGGGVTQTPDHWGNDYFDDTYLHNGKPERYPGYCTDVWFREAARFAESNRSRPFFLYLAPNAPHSPYNVAPAYADPHRKQGVPEPMASFYGMITNLDENVGRLRERLRELKLDRNTLLIFMTDNGSAAGLARSATGGGGSGFNAGMRGLKGSEYEGGHRVPCFFYWPEGALTGGARHLQPQRTRRSAAHPGRPLRIVAARPQAGWRQPRPAPAAGEREVVRPHPLRPFAAGAGAGEVEAVRRDDPAVALRGREGAVRPRRGSG